MVTEGDKVKTPKGEGEVIEQVYKQQVNIQLASDMLFGQEFKVKLFSTKEKNFFPKEI
ncbi:MAG: hypothetical protein QNJ47_23025 [Nostocaceae cyanobacterium]|nr:hypothetical protein [Nostocaceae cyanobacterium]